MIAVLAPVVLLLGWRTVQRNSDYSNEVEFCRKDTIARPLNSHAYRNLGLALVHQRMYEESIPAFTRAIELQPQNPTAHCNLAGSMAALGRTDEAERHYAEAIRQKPAYPEAYYNLGRIEVDRGDRVAAEQNLRQAIRFDADFVDARWLLGRLLAESMRETEAIEQYRAILRERPDHAGALNALAWILATSRDPATRNGPEAIALARKARDETGGKDPYYLDTLAAAYAEAGRFPDAIEAMEQAIAALSPNGRPAAEATEFRTRLDLYRSGRPFRR